MSDRIQKITDISGVVLLLSLIVLVVVLVIAFCVAIIREIV